MMTLVPEQEELLVSLVEAARRVPRAQQQFMHSRFDIDQSGGSSNFIEGDPIDGRLSVLGADVAELSAHGFIRYGSHAWGDTDIPFTITTQGFQAYESLRQRSADVNAAIEEDVARYLDSTFNERFPAAHEKLRAAEEMLWQSNPEVDFTTIGHKLREAVQQFATALVERYQPLDVDSDPARTKNRLRAVVELRRADLGSAKACILQALVDIRTRSTIWCSARSTETRSQATH